MRHYNCSPATSTTDRDPDILEMYHLRESLDSVQQGFQDMMIGLQKVQAGMENLQILLDTVEECEEELREEEVRAEELRRLEELRAEELRRLEELRAEQLHAETNSPRVTREGAPSPESAFEDLRYNVTYIHPQDHSVRRCHRCRCEI